MQATKNASGCIYHFHLKKCGGTTINSWIRKRTSSLTAYQDAWMIPFSDSFHLGHGSFDELDDELAKIGPSLFQRADFIYSHVPLLKWVPERTLRLTVLREPVSRLVSQIADWRRFTLEECESIPFGHGNLIRDAKLLPLREFLSFYGSTSLLNNYLVFALAAARIGFRAKRARKVEDLMPDAVLALNSFDVVGLTERIVVTSELVERLLSWPKGDPPQHLNAATTNYVLKSEVDDCQDILLSLTSFDKILYDLASKRFRADVTDMRAGVQEGIPFAG